MLFAGRRRQHRLAALLSACAVAGLPGRAGSTVLETPSASLRACEAPSLQDGLERTLQGLGLGRAVEAHRLAVALVDLSGPGAPRLAMVNGDRMMYAASLPKIGILLGAFVQAERGRLVLDPPTVASLNRMIRVSSNQDATAMLEKVGEGNLVDILTSPRYRLYDRATGGGLWVGKAYSKAPAYEPDPLMGLSHAATAFQVARFYYLLDRGRLVSPTLTEQMKEALADPAIHHKFVKGLESRPVTRLYRKSGTWRQFHADSALVEEPGKRYIIVGLADDPHGGDWLVRMAAPLDDLVSR
jgi:beta-lactamase class A